MSSVERGGEKGNCMHSGASIGKEEEEEGRVYVGGVIDLLL